MQLKIYQENAIEELLERTKRLLDYEEDKKLVFKAPTGSGKTIMIAEFLKRLAEDREVKQLYAFIWIAPRQLHIQSKEKLETYFEDSRALKCSFFEDLEDREIAEDEILFFNWESINKADNIYIRENERENNLSNILERTWENYKHVILIIDECHHHATREISKKLIDDIKPKLTIEVSATPVVENPDDSVTVQLEDVKRDGMIKKAVLLNPGFTNILKDKKIVSKLSQGSEEIVIDTAIRQRKELLEGHKKAKASINPLILIQLPDRKTSLEDVIKDKVIRILKDKFRISTENGKLAIWLSGEHINKEDVEKNNSEAEVLIFKQAIALGWDCPRAQILVLFRDWKSLIFSIQTIGRIMRMPEPELGHYKKQELNYGYVYTNLENIEIKEDIARDYITIYTSERKTGYEPIDLLSCYSKRHREKTRLSPLFIEIFLDEAKKYKLKQKIDPKSKKLSLKVISDWKAEDIDKLAGAKIAGDKKLKFSGLDLQRAFEFFIRQHLTPFYPEDRSIGRVKESIYRFFEQELKMKYEEVQEHIVEVVLSDKNNQHFINVINIAKESYQREVVKREQELESKDDWNIPESLPFGSDDRKENRKKSIMQPFFSDSKWKTERTFIDFLENSRINVEWWFKNGDRDATFFAVPYDNGEPKPFYVDFIVKLKDGKIGLFDTKAGFTQRVAGPKIDGLYKYIQAENKKGKKLFGGIVTNTDQRNYTGRWVYFDRPSKDLKDNYFDNWVSLEL
ncbi:MAG: DEAD/DEAH box helicase family protein [Candidatus Omnitrophica bacterium]|nr:DEAD/DEAH box helicase family protein [Candidatus Omnitrophota bacterium]